MPLTFEYSLPSRRKRAAKTVGTCGEKMGFASVIACTKVVIMYNRAHNNVSPLSSNIIIASKCHFPLIMHTEIFVHIFTYKYMYIYIYTLRIWSKQRLACFGLTKKKNYNSEGEKQTFKRYDEKYQHNQNNKWYKE